MSKYILTSNGAELYHYGVKGMKWGVRRQQQKGGSLTTAGRKNYSGTGRLTESDMQAAKKAKVKKAVKIGAAVAGTALAAYGTYKLSKFVGNKLQTKAYNKAFDAAKAVKGSYLLDQAKRLENDTVDRRVGLDEFTKRMNEYTDARAALRDAETRYAKQSSKNAAAVVKTLLDKNGTISIEDLMYNRW